MLGVKKRKRRHSSGEKKATPPEDLIEKCRRKEILRSFEASTESHGELLPITHIKKPLRRLQLFGLKIGDVKRYFEDDSLESLDADMFLRFAADKLIQMDKSNRAFRLMDEAKKGFVVFEDLQRVSVELGEDFTEDDLVEMIEFADPSGNGLLETKHLFRIARKTNL